MVKITMEWHSIREIVKGEPNDTQHQNNAHQKKRPIDCDWVQLASAQWYLYPYHDIENAEVYNWNLHLKPNRK